MALVAVAGFLLSGCFTTGVPDRLEHLFGVARIGDTYQVFVPLCPGEKVVGIKVDDRKAAWEDLDEQYGDDPYTWWRVAGPKAAAGPGEMIVLGADEPFTDVAVKAGSNAAYPVLPASFQVLLTATDLIGETDMTSWSFALDQVPAYPAGTDPGSVRYLLEGEADPVGREQIRQRSDCATGAGPIPAVTSSAVPGQQPAASIKPGAAERVEKALLGPNAVAGMTAVALDPPYVEDVASHVCGNGPQSGAVSTAFGQARVWSGGDDREVRQFAGAYGTVTAAEAVAQVDGVLGCGKYTEYMIKYTGVHQVDMPKLSGIDQQRMFCETVAKKSSRCTVLLARGDVLTRILARAANEQDAADLARTVAEQAAALR